MSYTIWFTGLPCSGKTTIAAGLKDILERSGKKVVHLDGDVVRKGLNSDLGFSDEDRKENLRRAAHMSQILNENGIMVLASFVSPTNDMRRMVSGIIDELKMVFVTCSLQECERRDSKGMYAKARAGTINGFTGIDAPFEEPEDAIVVDSEKSGPDACIAEVAGRLGIK